MRATGPDTCHECGRDLRYRSHAPDCLHRIVRCENCGERVPQGQTSQVEVTPPDEYYPVFVHICDGCQRDGGGGE